VANLKAGRFVRGASTITMQLAKNLLLSREKTVSRKLQEIVLADYLEQTFTKEEMMELYLNVIEFGPEIYGVGPAARHYFGRAPAELTLSESLFLSGLLPSPLRHHKLWEKGEVPASWMKNIHLWMQVAEKNGKISNKELADGLAQTIVFHKEGDPMPTPRPPVRGSHYLGDDANAYDGWVPVE
jgi:membrane peptidoglycan carboxypeptidase